MKRSVLNHLEIIENLIQMLMGRLTNDLTFSSTNQDRLENIETDFSLLLRNTNSYGDLSTLIKMVRTIKYWVRNI